MSTGAGVLIGSTATLLGALFSHRLTQERDRRNLALQGLRELAAIRMRMHQRDELEFEADLATAKYQWRVAGVSQALTSAYVEAASEGGRIVRSGGELGDARRRVLADLDSIVTSELVKSSRGKERSHRDQLAADLARDMSATQPERLDRARFRRRCAE